MCTGTTLGLGTKDLVHVYEELFYVRAKWRPIGLKLGLDPGTLDAIKQGQANPHDRLEAVLLDWLQVTKGATWEQLINALQSALVREIKLAEKLELKYRYCSPGKIHNNYALCVTFSYRNCPQGEEKAQYIYR